MLADVFADYRRRSNKAYKLDPIYCILSPGFASRAMLKHANAEVKLITDVNIHLTIKNVIRGGRCEAVFLKAEANNEYIITNFDKNKDTESHIVS